MKKTIAKNLKNWKILFHILLVLFLLLHFSISIPIVNAASGDNLDHNIIDKIVDNMDTLNDNDKQYYKNALKNIFTLDDYSRLKTRAKDYGDIEAAGKIGKELSVAADDLGALDNFKVAKPLMGVAKNIFKVNKINTIVNDGIAWIDASKAYNADPTNVKKDQAYTEKAFHFYNDLLPFGSIVFGMMADSIEKARERAEFEANQKKIFDKIIEDHKARVEMELRKTATMDRIASESDAIGIIFGEDSSSEPRWHTLRFFSDEKIERVAKYMQAHPDPKYNAYNAAAFLRMMKNGGPEKEAFLRNMRGGGPAGFAKHSPVYMTITDPLGHKYGVDPDTKRLLCDDAAICSPLQKASDAQYIVIPSIYNGIYKIQMVGYDNGEYSFLFHGFNHNSELQGKRKQKGYIRKGEVLEANLVITLNDSGYDIGELNFVKIADSYPIPPNPEMLLPAIDMDPLEIYFNGLSCSGSQVSFAQGEEEPVDFEEKINVTRTTINRTTFGEAEIDISSLIHSIVNTTSPETMSSPEISSASTLSTFCLRQDLKPKFFFMTNKLLDLATVNPRTVEVRDENNKFVEGLYEVDSTITFTPARPLYGSIHILMKGGKTGVCSQTKVCLGQDAAFEFEGASRVPAEEEKIAFELRNVRPALLTKRIVITNAGATVANDVTISSYSYKTYFPNTFVQLHNISSPVPFEILPQGENEVHKFKIEELPPGKQLIINETYAALSFGEEYFQRLDVSGLTNYDNATLVEMFTQPEEGIESGALEIIELAKTIVGEEKNPFWKAYKLYNWITANVQYDYEKEARITRIVEDKRAGITAYSLEEPLGGAMATFYSKKGVCYDYARLYIALARAVGIPSRIVLLDVASDEELAAHSTVEIYLPKYGWIPLDPTWGVNFDNFAREDPFIFPDYKQDGTSPLYEYLPEGREAEQLKVVIFKDVSLLKFSDEQGWSRFFPEPFFKDIYELVLSSDIKQKLEEFKGYNQIANESLFLTPPPSQRSSLVVTSQAIQAYKNKEYLSFQEMTRTTTRDNIQSSLGSFISVNEKITDFVKKEMELEPNSGKILINQTNATSFSFGAFSQIRYQDQNDTLVRVNYSETILQFEAWLNHTRELNTTLSQNNYEQTTKRFIELFDNSWSEVNLWAFLLLADRYDSKHSKKSVKEISVLGIESATESGPLTEKIVPLNFPEQLIQWFIIVFLFIAAPIFWLWMLVHCLIKKEFRYLNKILWFFIILFLSFFLLLGAILYFIFEYKKRNKISRRAIK